MWLLTTRSQVRTLPVPHIFTLRGGDMYIYQPCAASSMFCPASTPVPPTIHIMWSKDVHLGAVCSVPHGERVFEVGYALFAEAQSSQRERLVRENLMSARKLRACHGGAVYEKSRNPWRYSQRHVLGKSTDDLSVHVSTPYTILRARYQEPRHCNLLASSQTF